jgi:hypothetical protein
MNSITGILVSTTDFTVNVSYGILVLPVTGDGVASYDLDAGLESADSPSIQLQDFENLFALQPFSGYDAPIARS